MKVVAIIQARLTSTRLPRKVLMHVGGRSLISRVASAARDAELVDKVCIAWAHKFPHLDESNVLERFREIVRRENPDIVVRLTSDCPLLTSMWIDNAIAQFRLNGDDYFSNHIDGFDVQVFYPSVLWGPYTHLEHVIADFETEKISPIHLSVNTLSDLLKVQQLCETRRYS